MKKIILMALVASVSFIGGYWSHKWMRKSSATEVSPSDEFRSGATGLINPLLDCREEIQSPPSESVVQLEVEEFIDQMIAEKKISEASAYYRDLFNGPTFGVNSNLHFTPASLLKVPLMIAIFKLAEKDPQVLSDKVQYNPKADLPVSQVVDPPPSLSPGQRYTVEDLLVRMIQASDNSAAKMITDHFPKVDVAQTLNQMGIQMVPGEEGLWIDVKNYSSILRILYNATYLSRDYSAKALQILSKSGFHKGITEPLPAETIVAHKFGERTYKGVSQLHDCGIVYFPKRPYLICVMTRGTKFPDLYPVIAGVSKIIYKHVSQASGR